MYTEKSYRPISLPILNFTPHPALLSMFCTNSWLLDPFYVKSLHAFHNLELILPSVLNHLVSPTHNSKTSTSKSSYNITDPKKFSFTISIFISLNFLRGYQKLDINTKRLSKNHSFLLNHILSLLTTYQIFKLGLSRTSLLLLFSAWRLTVNNPDQRRTEPKLEVRVTDQTARSTGKINSNRSAYDYAKSTRSDWTQFRCDFLNLSNYDQERTHAPLLPPTHWISISKLSQYRSLDRCNKIFSSYKKLTYDTMYDSGMRLLSSVRNTRRWDYTFPSVILHNDG